jgi:hypothetical protein
MKKKNLGSTFDSWLRDEGIYEEATANAMRRVSDRQDVIRSSGNVFADMGLPDAAALDAKARQRARRIEARMMAKAIRESLKHLRTASEIAELAGVSPETMQHNLDQWKAERLIFSVEQEGAEHFPLYALDARENYRPYPAVKEIIRILGAGLGTASWFPASNGFLDNERPMDLLASDSDEVIAAARDAMEEISHGCRGDIDE